jgi:mRNA-degrading endonuclease HigB of HigAB toxin-antitoxin module
MYKLLIIENGTYIHTDVDRSVPLLYSQEEIKLYHQKLEEALFDTVEEIEEIFTRTTDNWQSIDINGIEVRLDTSSRFLFEIVEV